MNIRLKLTLWFTCLVALIVASGTLMGWVGLRAYLYHQAESELHDKQLEIQSFIETLVHEFQRQRSSFSLEDNTNSLENIFANDQTSLFDNVFIQLTNTRQEIVSRSSNLGEDVLPILDPHHFSGMQTYDLHLKSHQRPVRLLYSTRPIVIDGQPLGAMQLGLTLVKTEGLLRQLLLLESLAILLSIILSLVLGQFLAQRALAPMLAITGQVQQMAGQDLFKPLDTRELNPDEIGLLAKTFNGLMLRIEEVFKAQQRFLADASHEFKTPLTAIRGHAQLITKRGERPEIRERSAEVIIRESERLSRLVEDLLLLSRLESQSVQAQRLDLGELCAEVFEDLSLLHPELEWQPISETLPVMGHADSLRRVLLNLLSNAFAALENGGSVRLSCRRRQHEAEITVQDTGVGIAEAHLPHLFERFYRVDHSRSRSAPGAGGSGIGLALVYEIVRLHQGQVDVKSEPGLGTLFTLRFPLKAETSRKLQS